MVGIEAVPANTRHLPNAGLMLAQRRRRWANIKAALGKCLVLAQRWHRWKNKQEHKSKHILQAVRHGEGRNKNEMNRALGHLCAHIG